MADGKHYVFVFFVPSISKRVPMKIIEPPGSDNYDMRMEFKEFDRWKAMFPDTLLYVDEFK